MAAKKSEGGGNSKKMTSVVVEVGDPNEDLPFETAELRRQLEAFLNHQIEFVDPNDKKIKHRKIGGFQWGIYAFFDYDEEPIYVGQTNEKISTRIRRHLTNQRTDAVAMSVLDPYEVCSIQVWPLPEFEGTSGRDTQTRGKLNALEYLVFRQLLAASKFKAVLNEKEPQPGSKEKIAIPKITYRKRIVSTAVQALRDHPDLRIARRASTLARLAKVISERKVQHGLRKVLHTQAIRLQALAKQRVDSAKDIHEEGDE